MATTHAVFSLVIFSLVAFAKDFKGDYEGYQVLSVNAKTTEQVNFLRNEQSLNYKLDFWVGPSLVLTNQIMVPPEEVDSFKDKLKKEGLNYHVSVADVSRAQPERRTSPQALANTASRFSDMIGDYRKYHRYGRIIEYLSQFAASYPNLTSLMDLRHRTHEGRLVKYVKFGAVSNVTKPVIVIECGIHAREWIAPATCVYFLDAVLAGYNAGDADAMFMLDTFDWYIIPVANPDGYEYTHTHERLWRKNRRAIKFDCKGVDLNRNFDAQFGTTGISQDCRSNIYNGPNAFSEPETANIKHLVTRDIGEDLLVFLDIHSYSQVLLASWAFSENGSRPDNYEELDRVGNLILNALEETNGKDYQYGTFHSRLGYAASGTSPDWALLAYPGIYSYTYELRPKRFPFFELPPEEILAQGEEFYASLVAMSRAVLLH